MSYKVEDFIEDIITGREIGFSFRGIQYAIGVTTDKVYIALEDDGEYVWTESSTSELAEKGRIDGKLLTEIFDEIEIIDIA